MSAYVVDPEHINTLIGWAARRQYGAPARYYWSGEWHDITGNENKVGRILIAENQRSVNYRYGDKNTPPTYRYTPRPLWALTSPVQILKAVSCLDYQSCETPDWKDTEAYAILDAIKERAITELPGYELSAWEISPAHAALVILNN